MPKAWPKATIIVDAKTFRCRATYGQQHPHQAGHPIPYGEAAFAVLAAGVRGPRGKLQIVHIRATPDDHQGSWVDFFRSLPGRPESILSDPDPQISYAIAEVWPKDAPLHPLSVWHDYDKVREKFTAARLYPRTDPLCHAAEAAFRDPALFRAWRERAMHCGPAALRSWLKKKGNEVQARLEGSHRPRAIGALETFLTQRVGWALETGRGKIRNLRRLDIRLALIGLDQNRQLNESRLRAIFQARLGDTLDRPVPRRSLDGFGYDASWLVLQRPTDAAVTEYASINR